MKNGFLTVYKAVTTGYKHKDWILLFFVNRLHMIGQSWVHSKTERYRALSFTHYPTMHTHSITNILRGVRFLTIDEPILTYTEHSDLLCIYYYVCVTVCLCGHTHSKECMWR